MKLKNLIFGLGLSVVGLFAQAQTGLENVLVERYYVSNAADAAASTGALPVGSVTYRVYADMALGYKISAIYGSTNGHPLNIHTTTAFYNHEGDGAITPAYNKAKTSSSNTVMLDSWLSVGAGCAAYFGVPLSEDNGVLTSTHPAGVLTALNANDGLLIGTTQGITFVGGVDATADLPFGAVSQAGGDFTVTDGAWSALSGAVGPIPATNRILIGQFTTDGIFSYELNMQVKPTTGNSEKFVAKSDPSDATDAFVVTVKSFMKGTFYPTAQFPTVNLTGPATGTTYAPGAPITFTATAADIDGTVTKVEFFQGSTSLGLGTLAAGVYTLTLPTGLPEQVADYAITAKATDNDLQVTTSTPVVTISVGNAAPLATLTAPANAASYILGDAVTVTATATDADGTVASIEFFNGTTSLGVDNTSPYSVTFTPSVTGPITLTAKATDNLAKVGPASASRSITVVANQLPTVALGSISATPALGVALTLTATASDVDGTIASVEFFNGATSLGNGTLAAGVYSLTFTPSVQGATAFTAKATDNKGGFKVSVAVNVVITDLSAAYLLGTISQPCSIESVCLPITTNGLSVTGINGFNFSIKYDKAKVLPTGNVTVSNALILPFLAAGKNAEAITDYTTSIDIPNGIINIGINFNGSPGPDSVNRVFTGNGQVACVEFNKTTAFQSIDTAAFSFTEIIESYKSSAAVYKSGSAGKFITFKSDKMYASLKFWSDLSPIKYDIANPSTYLATNVFGCGVTTNAVQPDLAGNFVYSILNGITIDVKRDIVNTTNVHSVIDEQDAYLTSLVSVKGTSKINWTPSVFQMIAMDVNRDGLITSGDATQINQRAVRLIGEFSQIGGVTGKDWSFVANTKVNSDLSYLKSTTFPENDTHGYSKYAVPVVAVCQNVPVIDPTGCPVINNETYMGILIGDVDASYAGIAPNGTIKSAEATSEVVFNLLDAVKDNDGNLVIPVSLNTADVVNSFGFDVVLNDQKITVKSVDAYGINLNWNYFSADKMLQVASYSLNEIPVQNTATLTMTITGADDLTLADFNATLVKINGKTATLKVIDASMAGLNPNTKANKVNVYPNPTSDKLNIEVSSDSKVQILDLNGKRVGAERNVSANQKQVIDVTNLAKGIYMVKVSNNQSVEVKKIVIK